MRFFVFFCLLTAVCGAVPAQEFGTLPRTSFPGKNDSVSVKYLLDQADTVADPEQAIALYKQAITIARRSGNKQQEALASLKAGYVYCFKVSDIDSSDLYYQKAVAAFRTGGAMKSPYIETIGGLAYNLLLRGDYQSAFRMAMQGMELAQQQRDTTRMIELYSTLSNVAQGLADTQSTVDYMETAVKLARKVHYSDNMADLLMGLAGVYTALGRFPEALALLNEADAEGQKQASVPHRVLCAIYKANAFLEMKEYGKALYCIQQGRQLAKTIAYTGQELNMQYVLADIYLRKGAYAKTIAAADLAISLAVKQQSDHVLPQLYELKAKALEKTGRYTEALAAYREYMRLEEGQVGAEAQKTVAMLNKKYQSEQQQERIRHLHMMNEQASAKLRQERQQRTGLLLIAGLILLFGLVVSWLYRKQRKANFLVVQQRNKLDLLIREIHHRVKNNLQTISSMISLQQRYATDTRAEAALTAIQSKVNAIGLIHQRLYQTDASGKVPAPAYLEQLAASVAGLFGRDEGLLDLDMQVAPVRMDIDTAVSIALLLNELLTNSFKYAAGPGSLLRIRIVLERQDDKYILKVNDNGMGLSSDWEKRQQDSLGLRIVQMMARQVSGVLTYTYRDGACFVLNFTIPENV